MKERPEPPPKWAEPEAWKNYEDAYAHWVDYDRWEESVIAKDLEMLEEAKDIDTQLRNT